MTAGRSESRAVGVVVERRRIDNPWVEARWSVIGLVPVLPGRPAWSVLRHTPERTDYYAGAAEVTLHPTEAANYRDNLAGSPPSLYVILRRCPEEPGWLLLEVTADPGEVDAHSDAGDDLIEALPLPPDIAAWMQDFVARHLVERPFYKRQRDRPDPEAMARRLPRSHPKDEHDHGQARRG